MSLANIVGGLIFSGAGFVAFTYGRRQGRFRLMVLGGALMVYPYFVSSPLVLYLVGAGLSAACFLVPD
ncbi:MAG: hypothetical protein PHF00_00955 [Elusimicrobia bacterium]|nr:hypothetical protein [Elusimicrobiota bacterium]